MSNDKQTAVDWLFLMMNNPNKDQQFANKLLEKAKAIEKQQIVKAYVEGCKDTYGQFKASKQRKPLFLTEDGKQIFEGDEYWTVDLENGYEVRPIVAIGEMDLPIEEYKDFSTESAAREYVRLNKPLYSLNDIEVASNKIGSNPDEIFSLKIELEKLKQ